MCFFSVYYPHLCERGDECCVYEVEGLAQSLLGVGVFVPARRERRLDVAVGELCALGAAMTFNQGHAIESTRNLLVSVLARLHKLHAYSLTHSVEGFISLGVWGFFEGDLKMGSRPR